MRDFFSYFFSGVSKKLTAFLVTIGVVILNKKLNIGLGENDIYAITGGLGAYVVGQGISDAGFKGKIQAESKVNGAKK